MSGLVTNHTWKYQPRRENKKTYKQKCKNTHTPVWSYITWQRVLLRYHSSAPMGGWMPCVGHWGLLPSQPVTTPREANLMSLPSPVIPTWMNSDGRFSCTAILVIVVSRVNSITHRINSFWLCLPTGQWFIPCISPSHLPRTLAWKESPLRP